MIISKLDWTMYLLSNKSARQLGYFIWKEGGTV